MCVVRPKSIEKKKRREKGGEEKGKEKDAYFAIFAHSDATAERASPNLTHLSTLLVFPSARIREEPERIPKEKEEEMDGEKENALEDGR